MEWARPVRLVLRGALLVFAAALIGAVAVAGLHASPGGPTFGWPFRVTGRTNILIMGLDETESNHNPKLFHPVHRTDTLIAVSFDPASHTVQVLSVPRDTRVPIPGHGTTKINAAYAYGTEALARRTAENFLGVWFPYYITLEERGLVHLIDAVGGVNVRIGKDLNYDDNWAGLHVHLKKGYRRLGGAEAREYAVFRHDALGDIGRVGRQQQVIDALINELHRPRVVFRAGRVLKVFQDDMKTNLTPEQLVALGWFGAHAPKGGIVRKTLPGRFGISDWLPEPAKDRAVVARMFYGLDSGTLAQASVDVVTSGAPRDAVSDALARLAALGVQVVRVGAAPDAADSALIVHGGDPRVADAIASATGTTVRSGAAAAGQGPVAASVPRRGTYWSAPQAQAGGTRQPAPPQFTLVLGRDYAGRIDPPLTP